MKLKNHGKGILKVEVLNISDHGIWIYAHSKEYFMSFADFPWFKDATLAQIQDVDLLHAHHLFWPQLDVDLELESLTNLDKYSLMAR